MGFLVPDPPKPERTPPPASPDVTRQEANTVAEAKEKRRRKESSYRDSIRGGAVNPAYATGTKTHQGQ